MLWGCARWVGDLTVLHLARADWSDIPLSPLTQHIRLARAWFGQRKASISAPASRLLFTAFALQTVPCVIG